MSSAIETNSDGGEVEDEDEDKSADGWDILDGAYNPRAYDKLEVDSEVRDLFQYIQRYTAKDVEVETQMKCGWLVPYIPAIGKPNNGIIIPRPDGVQDGMGIQILAEPAAEYSEEPASDSEDISEPQKEDTKSALFDEAIKQGSKAWKRSKFSLLGQGRAGKTAFANALTGKVFEETASTVGINQLTCEVKYMQAGSAHEWSQCEKFGREYEAAVAALVAKQRRDAAVTAGAAPAESVPGGDIRSYMEDVTKPTTLPALHDGDAEDGAAPAVDAQNPSGEGDGHEAADTAENGTKSVPAAAIGLTNNDPEKSSSDKAVDVGLADVKGNLKGSLPGALKPPVGLSAVVAPRALALNNAPPPIDEDTVMRELAKLQEAESGLMISLFDFGGQAVFDVIHHLFLSRNGVYALLFNMEWLLHEGPERETALRFMRKWLSSITAHTLREGRTAPIVIVGTRLDTVSDPALHEHISTVVYTALHDSLAWPSVIKNDFGRDRNGRAEQVFFPVDNKLGRKGASMTHLMSMVQGAMDKSDYTHKEVPLTWFKAIDQMADTKKDCLLLQEVKDVCAACGVSAEEVPLFLSFLHDMGHLMWLNEDGLRDVVILDPVSYLVTPATIIICKLAPDSVDTTYHHMEVHAECQVKHRWEFDELVSRGLLSVKLLPILWQRYEQHSATLLQLMVKFGLLVPLRGAESEVPSQFLVPTLLSPAPVDDPELVHWTDKPSSQCYFVFTLVQQLELSSTLTAADLTKAGFLPGGMFERIVGKALSWSQDTAMGSIVSIDSVVLHKDLAILSFGRQRFRLVHCPDIHCVRVDTEGRNPVGIQQRLLDFVRSIVQECMGSLFSFSAVLYDADPGAADTGSIARDLKASQMLIPLSRLRAAGTSGSVLTRRGGRPLLTLEEVKSKYGQWLQLHELRQRYDVFVSYRWGQHDSKFTEQLFDMLTNYSVGAHSRAVEVFLDRKRLQEGRVIKSDFAAALTHSLVVVPVMSVDALRRMQDHDPAQADNVLLEWIMILESFAAGKILKVFPVLFGSRVAAEVSTDLPDKVTDFFVEGVKDTLPKTVPTATVAHALLLLQANGIPPSEKLHSYTVHAVVNELLEFLLCKASDFAPIRLVQTFAEKLLILLADCGPAVEEMDPPPAVSGAQPVAVPAGSEAAKPVGEVKALKDLTVDEVGMLLSRCGLKELVAVFATKEVTGRRLHSCDEYTDLMGAKVGVADKVEAKELLSWIEDWKEKGVVV